jgi:hypothetical protein
MTDPTDRVRRELGQRIADMQGRAARLSPLDIYRQMDAIREAAAASGMQALECLAQCSAQMALLPGHRVATRLCLEHMEFALDQQADEQGVAIMASLATRLH